MDPDAAVATQSGGKGVRKRREKLPASAFATDSADADAQQHHQSLHDHRVFLEEQIAAERARIAELNQERATLEEQGDAVRALWAEKRGDVRRLVESYETMVTNKANVFFYFERVQFAMRARSTLWWTFLFALKVLTALSWLGNAKLVGALLDWAFILNLRSLYVRHTPGAKPLGVAVLLFCLYMYFWPT